MVGHPLGSVWPPEESADAGAVAAARFDRPSGLPPEPFDELLPGNIGRTAADVSGHPNQLDSAQFRRGWRLPGRGEVSMWSSMICAQAAGALVPLPLASTGRHVQRRA